MPEMSIARCRFSKVAALHGEVVGTGGFLLHYNPPFADLYMEVREDARRRGYTNPNSFAAFSFMMSGRTSSRMPIVAKSAIHLSGVIHG